MSVPNTAPIFLRTPAPQPVKLTNQTLSRDGLTGASELLWTADANGSLISEIQVFALGAVAANVCRLFLVPDGELDKRLFLELSLPAVASVDNTSPVTGYPVSFTLPQFLFNYSGARALRLGGGDSLYASLGSTDTTGFDVTAFGGHY